jgi:hypothetical protein
MWDKAFLESLPKPKGARAIAREEFVDAEPVVEAPRMDAVAVVTQAQWERIGQILERTGRERSEVLMWVRKRYGLKNAVDLKRSDYAEVCRLLEARGPLPMPGDGE